MAIITLNGTNNGILKAEVSAGGGESLPSGFTLTYNGITLKGSNNSYDLPSNIGLLEYEESKFKIDGFNGAIHLNENFSNIKEITVSVINCSSITDGQLYLRYPKGITDSIVKLVYDYDNNKFIEFSGVNLSNNTLYLYNYIFSDSVNSKKTDDNKIIVINSKSFENGISLPFYEGYFYVDKLESSFNENLVISTDSINEIFGITADSIKHGTTLKEQVNFKITELSDNNFTSNDKKYLLSTILKSDTVAEVSYEIIIKNAELIKIGNRLVKINYPKYVENN